MRRPPAAWALLTPAALYYTWSKLNAFLIIRRFSFDVGQRKYRSRYHLCGQRKVFFMTMYVWRYAVSLAFFAIIPSAGYAVCYCACKTASGGLCTVSVPDALCRYQIGSSRCVNPTEDCRYDCSRKLIRPSSCSPVRRCSVRTAASQMMPVLSGNAQLAKRTEFQYGSLVSVAVSMSP